MKYFVCSDTHGFHLEFLRDLYASGFDINNDSHKLIVCGDICDGGVLFKEHLLFLYDLHLKDRVVILHGNHDYILLGFLKNLYSYDHYVNNGLKETLDSLLDFKFSFEDFKKSFYNKDDSDIFEIWQRIISKKIKKMYPFLMKFVGSFFHYYETNSYVFTHGSIDYLCSDWHKPQLEGNKCYGWIALHFVSPEYYKGFKNVTGKGLVVGHLNADLMRFYLENIPLNEEYQANSIYYNSSLDVYFIDTLTSYSRRVNFLVLDD